MAGIGQVFNALLDSGNVVSNAADEYFKKQADFDLNVMRNQLQEDINVKMREMQQSDTWENWEDEINNFFQEKINAMSDKNDLNYYCRNKYTADLAQQMIENARVNYQNQAANMALQKIQQQDVVKLNNSLQLLFDNYSGQDLIDRGKLLIDTASGNGLLDPQQYENYSLMIYDKAVTNEVGKRVDEILPAAVRAGKTWDQVEKEVLTDLNVQRYDRNGFMVETDIETAKNKAKKANKDKYDVAVYDYQTGNQKWFSDDTNAIYSDIGRAMAGDTSVNIGALLQQCRRGLDRNEKMLESALPVGVRDQNTKEYNSYINILTGLMEAKTTGKTTKLDNIKWTEKDAGNLIQFVVDSFKRGDQSTLGGFTSGYTAWDYFKNQVVKEYNEINGSNLSFVEIEKEMPIVGKFFEYLEKDLPPEYQGVINSCKNFAQQLFPGEKGQKDAYMEYWPEMFELIKDTLFEQDVSSLDSVQRKALAERLQTNINSMYGGLLHKKKQYEFMKDSSPLTTLSNYREGMNQERTMAKAMKERQSNQDLIYSDKNGNYKRMGTENIQNGLTYLEADERKMLKEMLGSNIEDKDISVDYQSDGVDDVTAQTIYTVGDYQYRFYSEDGKKIIAERKEVGSKEWEAVNTKKQQDKQNTPAEQARSVVRDYNVPTMPPIDYTITKGGRSYKLTQSIWENDPSIDKRKVIEEFIKKDPEAAQKWIESLEEREWIDDPISGRRRK